MDVCYDGSYFDDPNIPFVAVYDHEWPQTGTYDEPQSYFVPAVSDLSRPRTFATAFSTRCSTPCQQQTPEPLYLSAPVDARSVFEEPWHLHPRDSPPETRQVEPVSSVDTSNRTGRPKIQHNCAVCQEEHNSASDLERHGKQMSHKPYKCKYCSNSYLRRDVYLRHKNTHKNGSHACPWCRKTWARKDHLNQHLKSCRVLATVKCERDSRSDSVSTCFTAGSEISQQSEKAWSDADSVCSSVSSISDASSTKQQMRKATQALGDVLGTRYAGLIGRLSSTFESADDSRIELFAERMITAAMVEAELPSASSRSN